MAEFASSRETLTAVLRENFAYDLDPIASADEVIDSLKEIGWHLVSREAVGKALAIRTLGQADSDELATRLFDEVFALQGEPTDSPSAQ